jgi:proliferating cell nuclear antigen
MKLVLAESKYLKEPLFIISELVNEVTFKFTKDQLGITAMDPANVALISFNLLSSSFVDYTIDEDVEIGINLDNFKQVLRRVKPSDTLIMELEDNRLKVTLKSENSRYFNIPLINIEDQKQEEPKLEFTAKIEMSSSLFEEAISDVEVMSDAVDFSIEDGKIKLEAIENQNQALVELERSEDVQFNEPTGPIKSRYSVDYLKKIMKAGKLSDKVTLNFSNDYPLRADYKLMDKLSLSMILAPRVIND